MDAINKSETPLAATRRLAEFTRAVGYEGLQESVVSAAKDAFLDWVACAAVGCRTPAGRMAAELAISEGAKPEAMLFADGSLTSAIWAAFANGAGSYAIELDDVHMPSVMHGGVTVIPAAFATAQKLGSSGKQLIEAIAAGYDVSFRIGEAVAASHYERFHTTGTVGTFGAAAAVAKLLNLSTEQIQWALGNAGSQAAGLWRYLQAGTDTRILHPAKASMNGLMAADLAARGFTGPGDMLEAPRGFFASMAGDVQWDRITERLGEHFKLLENGYKVHACCRHAHVSVDLMLRICKERGLGAGSISRITVRLNPTSRRVLDDPVAATPARAAFSVQYLLALAVIDKYIGIDSFSEQHLRNAHVRELMTKVEIVEDPSLLLDFPKMWTAEVRVETVDGQEIREQADLPEGDPLNPLPDGRLTEKFLNLTSRIMDQDEARKLARKISTLDGLDDVSHLLSPNLFH